MPPTRDLSSVQEEISLLFHQGKTNNQITEQINQTLLEQGKPGVCKRTIQTYLTSQGFSRSIDLNALREDVAELRERGEKVGDILQQVNQSLVEAGRLPISERSLNIQIKRWGLTNRRKTRACDYCHARSIKCQTATGHYSSCQNCIRFAQPCTYERKPQKRGAKPRNPGSASQSDARNRRVSTLGNRLAQRHEASERQTSDGQHANSSWQAPFIASQAVIMDMAELYFEIVYPIFPFFHQPSFLRCISRANYTTDRALFAVTMAVCALVSSRIRDGAITNPRWDLDPLREPGPEVFYAEAKKQLASFEMVATLNVLRAHAILAITAIQNGNLREMRWHLGTYQTLVAVDGLHDEANWPSGIGVIEREERRRLFWSIYTLDIFTSSVCGGVVRSREEQCNVLYPAEIEDEFINDNSDIPQTVTSPEDMTPSSRDRPSLKVQSDCWLSGWNFITDLYRILEHALTKFRNFRPRKHGRSFLHDIFQDNSTLTEASVRDTVLQMYINLPPCFKETPEMTYDIKKDRVSFQAANISGSVQLLRIVLCVAGDTSIEDRCRVASDVVDALVSIPMPYSLAISTPLLHHLGGIGAILGSVFEEPLSETDYNRIRSIILLMAQLLEKMEAIQHATGASEKLKSLVARIDEYMNTQRHWGSTVQHQIGDGATGAQLPLGLAGDGAQTGYGQMATGIPEWSIQLPPDLLGDLTWEFDLAPWWT